VNITLPSFVRRISELKKAHEALESKKIPSFFRGTGFLDNLGFEEISRLFFRSIVSNAILIIKIRLTCKVKRD
jgi:hypothetical protein